MPEKCKISLVFTTDNEVGVSVYCEYANGHKIKGEGIKALPIALDLIESLVAKPLTETNKLPEVELI